MRCILHNWGKWKYIPINYISKDSGDIMYTISGQRKVCIRCGRTKVREG